MSGVHVVEITYEDGRVERRDCPCELCDIWRTRVEPFIDAFVLDNEPPVWPEWLGPKPDGEPL